MRDNLILDFTVIDAETTGRSNRYEDVTEISAIRYRDGMVDASYSSLVKAKNSILPFVENLTGITNQMIKDAPKMEDIIDELVVFIGQDIVLGHDVDFDFSLIDEAYRAKHGKRLRNKTMDTLKMSKCLVHDSKNHKLGTLCEYFGIKRENGHRSLYDCHQTAEVYFSLLLKYKEAVYECL